MANQNLPADGVISNDTTHNTFNFDNLPVRTFNKNGEVWFAAADVCAALEINNPRQAVTRLDDDEKGVISSDTQHHFNLTNTEANTAAHMPTVSICHP